MKILMVGDVHGNDQFFAHMSRAARDGECDMVLQLGDFGYWEHYPEGVSYLKWCKRMITEFGVDWVWLDGNHENHTMLHKLYAPGGTNHKLGPNGFWQIRDGLYYAPRGHRWTWGGVTFLALGGAASVDKEGRVPMKSWWPEEIINEIDMDKAVEGGKVDVMVTHDCPWGVDIPSMRAYAGKDLYPDSMENRKRLREVCKEVRPYFLAHGHYHEKYSSRLEMPVGVTEDGEHILWHNTQIEGLGCDMSPWPETHLIFDTEKFNASRPGL